MSTTPVNSLVANKLVSAYENFAFQLILELVKQDDKKNVFISPFSVAIIRAMIYNGAQEKTKRVIAEVLGIKELSLQEINEANRWLLSIGDNFNSEFQVTLANSLWVRPEISINDDFLQRLREAYLSEVTNLDFDSPRAATVINHWVVKKTQAKIKNVVTSDILRSSLLVLINAIYFKGTWTKEFDEQRTKIKPFTLQNGSSQPCWIMPQAGSYRYCENEQFQAVSLPYGERFSMYIFLPKPSSSLEKFRSDLNGANWHNWLSQFAWMYGEIELPRFKVKYDKSLTDVLIKLGMDVAFSDNANFKGIGAGDLKISEVIHKTFISVDEKGTEAAAVTATSMMIGGCGNPTMPAVRFRMVIDRPFFCTIRDEQTGALLFMGFILEPEKN